MNRSLATAMLESLGCDVDCCMDGSEGSEVAIHNEFDLVLMDCQMPIMDGFDATRKIQTHDQAAMSERRIIVACTANAMQGDSERCLDAGMDDYSSKPFTTQDLETILRKWTAYSSAPVEDPVPITPPQQSDLPDVIDQASLEEIKSLRHDGIPDPLISYIEIFLRTSPEHLDAIRAAVATQDPEALVRPAHSLKSDSANLGAKLMASYCKQFEEMGRTSSLDDAQKILQSLEKIFERVCSALQDEKLKAA